MRGQTSNVSRSWRVCFPAGECASQLASVLPLPSRHPCILPQLESNPSAAAVSSALGSSKPNSGSGGGQHSCGTFTTFCWMSKATFTGTLSASGAHLKIVMSWRAELYTCIVTSPHVTCCNRAAAQATPAVLQYLMHSSATLCNKYHT